LSAEKPLDVQRLLKATFRYVLIMAILLLLFGRLWRLAIPKPPQAARNSPTAPAARAYSAFLIKISPLIVSRLSGFPPPLYACEIVEDAALCSAPFKARLE